MSTDYKMLYQLIFERCLEIPDSFTIDSEDIQMFVKERNKLIKELQKIEAQLYGLLIPYK